MKRNLSLMRDLDEKSQGVLQRIDKLAADYVVNAKAWSRERRSGQVEEVHKLFNQTKGYGEEKVQLAMQTYEMVDKQIRRLDGDLARFEGELKQKILGKALGGFQQKRKRTRKSDKVDQFADEIPKISKKKNRKSLSPIFGLPLPADAVALSELSGPQLIKTLTGESGDVLDMPVDPNEPTYCVCHQVSYGEMIGCDNPDCPIEWFHFSCVGLNTKPKGKWFCPKCREERKK